MVLRRFRWRSGIRPLAFALAAAALLSLTVVGFPSKAGRVQAQAGPPLPTNAQVVASGLINPRGFTWGPGGSLYVSEAGSAPAGYTPPNGPAAMGASAVTNANGRIERIAPDGTRTTIVDHLPVFVGEGGSATGVSSLAFVDGTLYASVSAGPAHGFPNFAGGVYQIGMDGTVTLIADLDAFNTANPPMQCHHCGTPTDEISNSYDMVASGGILYISDGNKDVVNAVDPSAPFGSNTTRFADLSTLAPSGSHLVLTGIAAGSDGNIYVDNLTGAPFPSGAANVWRITPDGQVSQVGSGLTAATGLAVLPNGTIFASELAATIPQPPFFSPPGRVVMVNGDGTVSPVAAPLLFPGALRWHDGALYVAAPSIGSDSGTGMILRLQVSSGK